MLIELKGNVHNIYPMTFDEWTNFPYVLKMDRFFEMLK